MNLQKIFKLSLWMLCFGASIWAQTSQEIAQVEVRLSKTQPLPGEEIFFEVSVKILPPYHIYSVEPNSQVLTTQIQVSLPSDWSWLEETFQEPTPKEFKEVGLNYKYHEDTVVFKRKLKISEKAKAEEVIKGQIQFMTCTSEICLPPDTRTFEIPVQLGKQDVVVPILVDPIEIIVPEEKVDIVVHLPETIQTGETFVATVSLEVAEGWSIYGIEQPLPYIATQVQFALPSGVEAVGELKAPPSKMEDDPILKETFYKLKGALKFEQTFRVTTDFKDKELLLKGAVRYQACDANSCLAPKMAPFQGKANVLPPIVIKTPPPPDEKEEEKTVSVQVSIPENVQVGEPFSVVLSVKVGDGWSLYGVEQTAPYIPTKVEWTLPTGVQFSGVMKTPKAKKERDPILKETFYKLKGTFQFEQNFVLESSYSEKEVVIQGSIRSQACNDMTCLAPETISFQTKPAKVLPAPKKENTETKAEVPTKTEESQSEKNNEEPKKETESASEEKKETSVVSKSEAELAKEKGLLAFIFASIIAGIVALAMPCVYPMIPITVSFFSKQAKQSGHNVIFLAFAYFIGIISIFTSFGLILALALGATGAQQVAANPWVNLFITVLFVAFALSLFGLFEIQAPSFLVSRASEGSRAGGLFGVLMMGFVFALASFTCTVPFIGGLLLISVEQGDWLYPILGMVLFSGTMGLPFFFLALFPKTVNSLPQGGEWMTVTKISLGFVELWAATKFAVNVDQVWELAWLTRPVVLSFWTGLTIVLSLYLFNVIRLKEHGDEPEIGPMRMVVGILVLSLAIYFYQATTNANNNYGFWEAFLPRITEESVSAEPVKNDKVATSNNIWYKQLAQALEVAKKSKQPIFIDFTGVT